MAGYSKTKLIDKLGIKPGWKIYLLNTPGNYFDLLGTMPDGISITRKLTGKINFIHYFTKERKELEINFPVLKKNLLKDGMMWISWPKGSSKVKTDINENVIRETGLREGLVDVKVCSVDEIWSGLKFVYRITDRK